MLSVLLGFLPFRLTPCRVVLERSRRAGVVLWYMGL